jgi:hypothetical protein
MWVFRTSKGCPKVDTSNTCIPAPTARFFQDIFYIRPLTFSGMKSTYFKLWMDRVALLKRLRIRSVVHHQYKQSLVVWVAWRSKMKLKKQLSRAILVYSLNLKSKVLNLIIHRFKTKQWIYAQSTKTFRRWNSKTLSILSSQQLRINQYLLLYQRLLLRGSFKSYRFKTALRLSYKQATAISKTKLTVRAIRTLSAAAKLSNYRSSALKSLKYRYFFTTWKSFARKLAALETKLQEFLLIQAEARLYRCFHQWCRYLITVDIRKSAAENAEQANRISIKSRYLNIWIKTIIKFRALEDIYFSTNYETQLIQKKQFFRNWSNVFGHSNIESDIQKTS